MRASLCLFGMLPSIEKKLVIQEYKADSAEVLYTLPVSLLESTAIVRFRQGGERIKPAGRNGTHDLKSLFQEAAVPTWQRDKIPLLYVDDELVAVVGFWLADNYVVKGSGLLPVLKDIK